MSSGVKGAIRVTIPSSVKKTIENIKEITGQNHSEDEIYATLKECSMDPNETAQKLLLLDTFHEVKRKRDRRKENLNKEPREPRWKSGTQVARANKGSRGNYSSRCSSHVSVDEIATSHLSAKGVSKAPLTTSLEMKTNEASFVMSPIIAVPNGPSGITSQSTHDNHDSAEGDVDQFKATVSATPLDADSIRKVSSPEIGDTHQQIQRQIRNSENSAVPIASASAAASYSSFSDPVQFPSQELPIPSAVSSIMGEVENHRNPVEIIADNPTEINSVSAADEAGSSILQQKISNELHVVGKNQNLEFLQNLSSTTGVSSVRMDSSNYNNRSEVTSPQNSTNHVGAVKEWKQKPTSFSVGRGSNTVVSSEVSPVPVINYPQSQPPPIAPASGEATLDLRRKLEESHISDIQHVIIPNHLHVPESGKLWFRFGSFDADFNFDKSCNDGSESDQNRSFSESFEAIDRSVKEILLSDNNQNELVVVKDSEIKYPYCSQSPPTQVPAIFSSSESEVPSSVIPDYIQPKQEAAPGSHQHAANRTSSYNFGFMPPVMTGQRSPLESSEAPAREATRLPGFIQSFDPSSYYAQFYRSTMDGDGRISPFHPVVVANKQMGNISLISAQTSQSPQEGVVPLVLPNSPTLPATQAAGVMQSSITATQQPFPVFRQPTGVHLPHYPPNYIPYGPYFSPFYPPPQAILQFLSSTAFPQQPQVSSMYPTPPGTTVKYSVSPNKQGSNTGNSTQIGIPGSYGPYGLSTANYITSFATAVASSAANEDLSDAQLKENNIYASGQKNEGSGVWFTTPARDISTLQASSFYNLPQGQLAFAPTQPSHGTFTGIFHPAQAITAAAAAAVHPLLQQSQAITSPIDMVESTAHVYQQPQHAQLNWPMNY